MVAKFIMLAIQALVESHRFIMVKLKLINL